MSENLQYEKGKQCLEGYHSVWKIITEDLAMSENQQYEKGQCFGRKVITEDLAIWPCRKIYSMKRHSVWKIITV